MTGSGHTALPLEDDRDTERTQSDSVRDPIAWSPYCRILPSAMPPSVCVRRVRGNTRLGP